MQNWTKQLELETGWWVRLRPVPPLASASINARPEFDYPPPPKVTVDTLAGGETVDAPDDSPETTAYWARCNEIDRARNKAGLDFAYTYGVVSWSENPDAPDEKWLTQPPKGWTPDPALKAALPDYPEDDPRLAWVKFGLIVSNEALVAVNAVIFSQKKVEGGEVASTVNSFQD